MLHFSFTHSQAFISIRRLTRFLGCSEYKHELEQAANSPSSISNGLSNFNSKDMAVIMQDATCSWYCNNEEEQNVVLNQVSLCLPKGSLVAVIGEVSLPGKFLFSNYSLFF